MSQRSIIEINHDFSFRLDDHNTQRLFVIALRRALASGSDENWEPLKHFGIRRVTQCHHSDDRKVIVGATEYPIP